MGIFRFWLFDSVDMGKKSKRGEEEEASDQKIQLPRKRGRPRKNVIEKTETDGSEDSEAKKARTHEEEEKDRGIESSSFSGGADAVEDREDKKKEKETQKRKGRRKGQPRKSS